VSGIFFDIDGTIKPANESHIPITNALAIQKLFEKKIQIFVATGRCFQQIQEIFESLIDSLSGFITENGAYVLTRDGTVIYNALLTNPKFSEARTQLKRMFEEQLEDELRSKKVYFQNNTVNLTIKPAEGTSVEDSQILVDRFNQLAQSWLNTTGLQYSSDVQLFVHWDALDIVPVGVSKDEGIKRLSKLNELHFNTTLYGGDAQNDPFAAVAALKMLPVTHGSATKWAIGEVERLHGVVFYECNDGNFASCLLSAMKYNRI